MLLQTHWLCFIVLQKILIQNLGQSQLQYDFIAIAKENDIAQWGFDVVLKRILQDLSVLYNGVRIEMSNGEIEQFGVFYSQLRKNAIPA